MKKLMKICMLVACFAAGCSTTIKNEYLGNLEVGYHINIDGQEIDQERLEFYYGNELTRYVNRVDSLLGTYEGALSFQVEDDINDLRNQDCQIKGYEDKSWEYYFADKAKDTLHEIEALTLAAKEDGFEINDEDKENAKIAYQQIEKYCETSEISINDYIRSTFGLKATKNTIIKNYQEIELAQRYADYLFVEPTREEVELYYEEHPSEIDTVNIRYLAFSLNEKDEATQFVNNVKSEADFIQLAMQLRNQDTDFTLRTDLRKTDVPTYLQEPIFHAPMQVTEVKMVEWERGYDVVMLIKREKPMYRQANISTIYVDAKISDGDELRDEKMETSRQYAEDILSIFLNGEDTSLEQFHALNKEFSDVTTNQGDYSGLSKLDISKDISDWIFTGDREEGETKVLSSTTGYTIIYFRSYGDIAYYAQAKELEKVRQYDIKLETMKEAIEIHLIEK